MSQVRRMVLNSKYGLDRRRAWKTATTGKTEKFVCGSREKQRGGKLTYAVLYGLAESVAQMKNKFRPLYTDLIPVEN